MIYSFHSLSEVPLVMDKNGIWGLAKPVNGPFIWEIRNRLRAAWWIITGKAIAVAYSEAERE